MPCDVCNATGWKTVETNGVSRVTRCECWHQQATDRSIASARIQKRYAHCELSNFKQHTDSQRDAFRKAMRFVEHFPAVERGLLLHGETGVGKTHLAAAILKAVIREKRIQGYFYVTGELLKLVRHTYSTNEAEMDVLKPVLEADLLVLDDLGVEKTSEWVQETLGHVVNIRYSERRPTVITTNLVDSADSTEPRSFLYQLGARTRSRLFEMCDWAHMAGMDSRELGGPDVTPEQIQNWEKKSPLSPKNRDRARSALPARSGGQARAHFPPRDGKTELKWPGGRAGS